MLKEEYLKKMEYPSEINQVGDARSGRQGQVAEELTKLHACAQTLDKYVDELESRLLMVLRQPKLREETGDGKGDVLPQIVPLATHIRETRNNLENATGRLGNIIERLEL